MDRDSIERIRTATFAVARKGYDKRQVDRFLEQVADWLESGQGDDARSQVVRNALERVGEQTAKILTDAHDVAEGLRAQSDAEARDISEKAAADATEQHEAADRYASGVRAEADTYSERAHIEADEYASETRSEADAFAARKRNEAVAEATTIREDAEAYAETTRQGADEEAAGALHSAEQEARKVVEDANHRRREAEKVIDDLEARRQTVLEDMRRLSTELEGTASQHRPEDAEVSSGGGATEEFSVLDDEDAEHEDAALDGPAEADAEYEDAESRS
jgi:DivIVA domain-containing protein